MKVLGVRTSRVLDGSGVSVFLGREYWDDWDDWDDWGDWDDWDD